MKNRKAQLQIMENALIIMVIFIILVIAFIFVVSFQKEDYKAKQEEFKQLELLKRSQILNFLPEMQCSDNNIFVPDCYDILKIEAFTKLVEEDKLYYDDLIGNIKLTIRRYEPSPNCDCLNNERWLKTWNVFDNPKEDREDGEEENIYKIQYVRIPVLLMDPVNNANYFGLIILGVYE